MIKTFALQLESLIALARFYPERSICYHYSNNALENDRLKV